MKNKKGFTLIELLAVFIIMFMILGIAIYSFTKIKKSKEEEAWEQVKQEVMSAAVEYFNSNTYILNESNNCDDIDECSAIVSVGTLVKNDYINKVVNPITKKEVDSCDLVIVNKNSTKYLSNDKDKEEIKTLTNNGSKCDSEGMAYNTTEITTEEPTTKPADTKPTTKPTTAKPITTTQPKLTCPTFKYKYTGNTKEEVYQKVEITVTPKDGTTKWDWYTNIADTDNLSQLWGTNTTKKEVSLGGNGKRYGLVIIHNSNNETKECKTKTFKLDNTAPEINIRIIKRKSNNNSYDNYVSGAKLDEKDFTETSGNNMKGYGWQNKSEAPYGYQIYYLSKEKLSYAHSYWNKAGLTSSNVDSNSYKWIDATTGYKNGGHGNLTLKDKGKTRWYTYLSAEGKRKIRLYFKDLAGNTTGVTISLDMDRTSPTASISTAYNAKCTNTSTKNGYSKGTTVSGTCSDSMSGPVNSKISKTLNTLGSSINTASDCKDKAGNHAAAKNYKVCVYSANSSCGTYCSAYNYNYSCPSGGTLDGSRCNKHTGPYTTQSKCRDNCSGSCIEPGTGYGTTKAKPWVCMTSYNATSSRGSCKTYSYNSCYHY